MQIIKQYTPPRSIDIAGRSSVQGKSSINLINSATMSSSENVGAGGKKTSWPEVVGLCVEEAKKVILKDKPDADIVILPVGTPVTKDFREDRVRVFIDTVAETPSVG